MADIRWTDDQRRAIETVGRSVIVSAAAGSGKTAVLAERFVYLVCDAPPAKRCGVDELLVVTFGEPAAAEMRWRIRNSLQDRLAARPNDDYLRLQAALLDTAHISTIHSFCRWLIRRWFNKLGVDPASTVLAADEARILKADTLAQIVADRYASQDATGRAFRHLIDVYGLGQDEGIVRYTLRLAEFLESLPDPDQWASDSRDRLVDHPERVIRDVIRSLGWELGLQRENCQQYAAAAKSGNRGVAFYGRILAGHSAQLGSWRAAVEDLTMALGAGRVATDESFDRIDVILKEISDYSLSARGAPRMGDEADETAVTERDAAKAAFDATRDLFKKRLRDRYARFSNSEMIDGLVSIAPHAAAVIDLVQSFRNAYREAKRRLDVLDFADLERYAYQLLSTDDVATAVRGRFAYVLVDEYQDVNRLQAELLRRVSREDNSVRDANLFTVGDVKQSIYRFRSAEPRVFLDRLKSCPGNPDRGLAVFLRDNYRSRATILDGVNRLFSVLMRPEVGGIQYGEREALRPGRQFQDGGSVYKSIDVHLLDRKVPANRDEDDTDSGGPWYVDPDDPAEWQAIEREAYVIAMEIRQMRSDGLTLEGGKKVEFCDIAILLRAPNYTADAIARFLGRFGIEAYSAARGTLFDTLEIRDVRSLLEVLDNMQQDIPLAALLRSPVLPESLSEDDLLAIRGLDRDVPFHETVRRYAEEGGDAGLRSRLTTLLNRIKRYRRAGRLRAFPEVLWELLEGSGYLAYVGGLPGGAQRRANLLRFFERARQFGSFKQQGIRRFLRFLEMLEQEGEDLGAAPAAGQSADAVQIMSIHASKGLEFPVVFVADLGRRFNLDDARGRMIFDRDAGIGMNVVDRERMIEYPSATYHLAAAGIELETRAEELRVLYVALTRAKERLILVGSTALSALERTRAQAAAGHAGVTALSIATATKPLDWLVPALAALPVHEVDWSGNHPDVGRAIPAAKGERSKFDMETKAGVARPTGLFRVFTHNAEAMADWRIEPRDKPQTSPLLQAVAGLKKLPPDEPTTPDSTSAEHVLERVRFDYPHLAVASVPAVVAASEVKHIHDVWRDPEERPRDFLELDKDIDQMGEPGVDRAAAQLRGTATHKVLQHLDFTLAGDAGEIGIQLDRLRASGVLTSREAELVDSGQIAWFAGTPLGRAVRDAGEAYVREFMFIAGHPAQWFDDTLAADVDEQVLVRGIVDGVLLCNGGIEVIDFKTDRVSAKGVARAAERYRRQMKLYAASIAPIFERPVTHCRLVFLHPRVIVSVDGTGSPKGL